MGSTVKDKSLTNDILVVDDEADIRALIKGILNDEGLMVREAGNSDETLNAIKQRKPSLVILDIWLQGSDKDGMEILKYLRANDDYKNIAGDHDQRPRQYRHRCVGHQDGRL